MARRFADLRDAPDTISLFHRALLRFSPNNLPSLADRDHFFRSWQRAMRSVIADLYRFEQRHPVHSFDDRDAGNEPAVEPGMSDLDRTLDQALANLAEMDPVAAQIVHLRHFDERTWHEIASQLSLTYAAVQRKWTSARAWLRVELKRQDPNLDAGEAS